MVRYDFVLLSTILITVEKSVDHICFPCVFDMYRSARTLGPTQRGSSSYTNVGVRVRVLGLNLSGF